jgi:hypothetical protein
VLPQQKQLAPLLLLQVLVLVLVLVMMQVLVLQVLVLQVLVLVLLLWYLPPVSALPVEGPAAAAMHRQRYVLPWPLLLQQQRKQLWQQQLLLLHLCLCWCPQAYPWHSRRADPGLMLHLRCPLLVLLVLLVLALLVPWLWQLQHQHVIHQALHWLPSGCKASVAGLQHAAVHQRQQSQSLTALTVACAVALTQQQPLLPLLHQLRAAAPPHATGPCCCCCHLPCGWPQPQPQRALPAQQPAGPQLQHRQHGKRPQPKSLQPLQLRHWQAQQRLLPEVASRE